MKMKIIIDSREPNNVIEMIENVATKYNIEIQRKHLFVGDYIIETEKDIVAVERKTVADYIMGIKSGRLATQLYNMSSKYEFSYIVVVGYFSIVAPHTEMRRDSYLASLINASLKRSPEGKRGQVISINLETDHDFALFLSMLATRLNSGSRTRLPIIERTRDNEVSAKASMFTAIPGLGSRKAKKMMKHFGSVKDAVNATEKDYLKIDGIGKKLAEKIYSFFNDQ